MKINTQIFKNKWFLYAAGGIVVFAVFYRLASSGQSENAPQIVTVGATPDPATAAVQGQIAMAQIGANAQIASAGYEYQAAALQANRDIALGTLQADNMAAETAAFADLQKYIAANESAVAMTALDAELQAIRTQAEFNLDAAEVAGSTQIALKEVEAAQFITQLTTNAQMFDSQLRTNQEIATKQAEIAKAQTNAALITNLVSGKDENELSLLLGRSNKAGVIGMDITDLIRAVETGAATNPNDPRLAQGSATSKSGFNLAGYVSPITNAFR